MYKFAFALALIFLASTASAHKIRCEDGFFYISNECVAVELDSNDTKSLSDRFQNRAKVLEDAIASVDQLAISIENKANQSVIDKNINELADKAVLFVENHFAIHDALKGKIKMRRGTEDSHKYKKDISGLSIYKALFELYEVFDEAELFDYGKRDITYKHNAVIEPLNTKLIETYRAFAKAYKDNNKDYLKEKTAYTNAVKEGITALANIYAMELKQINPNDMPKVEYGRNDVIEDLLEDVHEDTYNDMRRLQHRR